MIKQYLAIKDQYKDAILFYRMGDFYEMFFEDAQQAAKALEITLTSRNKNDSQPIPMCGVPYRAAKSYIARLIEQGFKVAVCDQIEDPARAKGLVKREVVQVITPGMIVENDLLDAGSNNYLCAVVLRDDRAGAAFLDISTGEFLVTEHSNPAAIISEAQKANPPELLLPEAAREDARYAFVKHHFADTVVTYQENRLFEPAQARRQLLDLFGTISLEGFGCEDLKVGVAAAGGVVSYLEATQKQNVTHIERITPYTLEAFLQVDQESCRNLELLRNIHSGTRRGTLISVLDRTCTAMGARMLKRWLRYPSLDLQTIEARLSAVAVALEHFTGVERLRVRLKEVADLERLISKICLGRTNARDLLALRRSLQVLPAVRDCTRELEADLYQWPLPPDSLTDLAEELNAALLDDTPLTIQEGGMFREGYDPDLDELIAISREGKGWLARLETEERQVTGINSLKVKYNKVFGYYIEVSKANLAAVPEHYVRKQTLVNAERFITDELKKFENKVLGAEERRASLEYDLFNALRQRAAAEKGAIFQMSRYLAQLDCLLSLTSVAEANNYHRPRINDEGILQIEEGRHPVVEKMVPGERFVPNTITLNNLDQQVLIITGPNMAGKSTVLRQAALTVIMAQMGSFVPAAIASVCLTDRIFTRVGALDKLASGQSTFLVEMQETAKILNNATASSLVIMDEIGRGTSTFDGLSIAWAVASYLHDLNGGGVKTLFATHYHELTALAQQKPRVKNFNVAVKEWNNEIIFLRKLVEGGTNRSYGIQVARLAGVPAPVVEQAKRILDDIENGRFEDTLRTRSALSFDNGIRQLSLFEDARNALIKQLVKVDTSHMTPLEALNRIEQLRIEAMQIQQQRGQEK
jgi:DNA mismatch repair protein MutS